MADYIEREVPWDDQYISKTDAIKLAAITVVPFATSENIQDIHKAFERTIDKYPAANVEPVVHGKWDIVEVEDVSTKSNLPITAIASMRCNQCNRFHNEVYYYGDPTEYANYCPNCGARMDGEDNG